MIGNRIINYSLSSCQGFLFWISFCFEEEENVLFQTNTKENALDFVGEVARPIEEVTSTFTLLIQPLNEIENYRIKSTSNYLQPAFFG